MTEEKNIKNLKDLELALALMKPDETIHALKDDLMYALYPNEEKLDVWENKGFLLVNTIDLPLDKQVVSLKKIPKLDTVLIVISAKNSTFADSIKQEILQSGGLPVEIDFSINNNTNYLDRVAKLSTYMIMDSEMVASYPYLITAFQDLKKQIKYLTPNPNYTEPPNLDGDMEDLVNSPLPDVQTYEGINNLPDRVPLIEKTQ